MEKKCRGKLDVLAEDLEEVLSNIFTNYSFGKNPCPVDKNGWVYGNLIDSDTPYIVGEVVDDFHEGVNLRYWYPVKKATIGQFIGLKDLNGNKIFEGDIVKCHFGADFLDPQEIVLNCRIGYDVRGYGSELGYTGFDKNWSRISLPTEDAMEVIGNFHDNPELLEEEEE